MASVLDLICGEKRAEIAERRRRRPLAEVEKAALGRVEPPRGFRAGLARAAATGYGLIAEIKKASPSKGVIREDFDPAELARAYAAGGATCLSVLTHAPRFQGRDEDLTLARRTVDRPILRKDFMLDPYQVFEAREMGADCILLIMAALDDDTARTLEDIAEGLGLDVLVEVHNEAELERGARLRSRLIGINNRDLATLSVDLATTERLAGRMPEDALAVSESGLAAPADLARMAAAGVRCFLIGEALMRQADVALATRELLAAAAGAEVAA